MKTTLKSASLLLLIALACTGCSNGNKTVYPVMGKITLNGKPMEGGGSIAFVPVEGQDGKTAGGVIDDEGNYTLSTYGDGDGSIPGKFRVVIIQSSADEPEATPDGQAPRTEAIVTLSRDKMIPPVYSDFKGSPLSATVKAESNELDFDLKGDAAAPVVQQYGA